MALEDLDGGDDAASRESQQGIVRTVEVSMNWKTRPEGRDSRGRDDIVPRAIADSER